MNGACTQWAEKVYNFLNNRSMHRENTIGTANMSSCFFQMSVPIKKFSIGKCR